ncbi:MAG: SprA-related family protein [Planctomycetes bacterium]|nr:SprA-related family protein [Planctomycetota bacterium]
MEQTGLPETQTGTQTNSNTIDGTASNQTEEQNSQESKETEASEATTEQLTQEELRVVDQLQQRDQEVRTHEMAHIAAGGSLITSGASFTYQQGPDGQNYAVGGEVSIDTSPVPGDPQATAQKMRQVRSAALAPGSPSAQDLKVASNAATEVAKAMSEITMLQAKAQAEQRESQAFGNSSQEAADTYAFVGGLPEEDTNTFELAV